MLKRVILAVFLAWATASPSLAEPIPAGFNDEGIAWFDLSSGLKEAEASGKPAMILAHATWCPVCKEYKQAFFDTAVVAASKDIVFILIDVDAEPEAGARYEPDGGYIPRTMVVDGKGNLVRELTSGNDSYNYFLDPSSSDHLLEILEKAAALNP